MRIGIPALRLSGRDGVEYDGRGIGAVLRPDDVDAGPTRPDLELLDGCGAECVGRADERLPPFLPEQVREFADRGGLAGPVHADDQGHDGSAGGGRPMIDAREHVPDLLFHQISKAFAAASPALDGRDDPLGRRHADVGGNQHFLEGLERLDVNRPRTPLRLVGLPDEVFEAVDDLLLGAGKTIAEPAEDAHCSILSGRTCGGATSRRPGH